MLAGAFISLGALFYLVIITDTGLGFGVTRPLGGLAFSLGLILVVVAGAELFTGNNLLAMAWASGRIPTRELLRNWGLSYLGTALRVASGKTGLSLLECFTRGVFCNVLVCLAVWLAMGARSVTDKIVAIVFPVTVFAALG